MLREQQIERMAEESSEAAEPEAPELKYWQKEAAQQEAAAGATDGEERGEDREADPALTPRERHHEHHVDAEVRPSLISASVQLSDASAPSHKAHMPEQPHAGCQAQRTASHRCTYQVEATLCASHAHRMRCSKWLAALMCNRSVRQDPC